MSFHIPDRYFSRLSDIDIDTDIINEGFDNVLLDVDNTILTRDTSTVPKDIAKWINKARERGITLCLISNDWHSNVVDVARDMDLPIVVRSLKPLPHAFFMALRRIGGTRNNTVMIGDQLMTDIFGAHLVGMHAYLLTPLVKADLKHTLFLRKFEKMILKGRLPEPATIRQLDC